MATENVVEQCGEKRKSRYEQVIADEVEPQKTEFENYLEEKVLRWKDINGKKFDVLDWWKLNVGRFLVLGAMARDVFGIPVSTVASESAFSTGGRVVDSFRSRLTPDMVEALICAQDWLKAETIDGSDSCMSFQDIDASSLKASISDHMGQIMSPTAASSSKASTSDHMELQAIEQVESDTMEDEFWY